MTKASVVKALKEKGLKVTRQRMAVVEVLIENRLLHPGAGLVYREAKKMVETLSLSTVYATLNEISRLGIIKELQFDRMENRYEANLERHVNLICKRCKKIVDYEAPVDVDAAEVTARTGFTIVDARFEFYGLCRNCKEEGEKAGKSNSLREVPTLG